MFPIMNCFIFLWDHLSLQVFVLWMFPIAIAAGNTFVIKPSERVAGGVNFMMNLLNGITYKYKIIL